MGPTHGEVEPSPGKEYFLFPSYSYPTHPGVKVPLPTRLVSMFRDAPQVDLIHSQTMSHMIHYAIWMRKMNQVPFLNTHVIHLPTHCHFILSEGLYQTEWFMNWWRKQAVAMESNFAKMYNQGDCLIVQSRHFVPYWRERGVTVPIEVVGRPINPAIFSKQAEADPYRADFKQGGRLLVVCRHDREKNLRRLLRIFNTQIVPTDPHASLTLVGDGHDHENLVSYANTLTHRDRIEFVGEAQHGSLVSWYSHADVFAYTSLSETFGNVVNEALWCGLPVVCLDDRMGVSGQIIDGLNGVVVDPESPCGDEEFAAGCLALLRNRSMRRQFGAEAATLARRTAHPDVVLGRFESIYADAKRHCALKGPVPLSQRSKLTQVREYARSVAQWSFWTAALFALSEGATRFGVGRDELVPAPTPERIQPATPQAPARRSTSAP